MSITIATSNDRRFDLIINELVPVLSKWSFLRNAVFIKAPLGTAIVWQGDSPSFVYKEAIAISGVGETGGNFDSYQKWRSILTREFKNATGIETTAA